MQRIVLNRKNSLFVGNEAAATPPPSSPPSLTPAAATGLIRSMISLKR